MTEIQNKIQAQGSKRKMPQRKACGFLQGRQKYNLKRKAKSFFLALSFTL